MTPLNTKKKKKRKTTNTEFYNQWKYLWNMNMKYFLKNSDNPFLVDLITINAKSIGLGRRNILDVNLYLYIRKRESSVFGKKK